MQKDFSYPLKIDELGQGEQHYKLTANEAQLGELGIILQIPAVNKFQADLLVNFQKRSGKLTVSGKVEANLRLTSVISLEEFDREYQTQFSQTYDTTATYEEIREQDEDISMDIPDVVYDGKIDLGDICIEQIALIMEDNPRQAGEEFTPIISAAEETPNNPFSVLAKLKKN